MKSYDPYAILSSFFPPLSFLSAFGFVFFFFFVSSLRAFCPFVRSLSVDLLLSSVFYARISLVGLSFLDLNKTPFVQYIPIFQVSSLNPDYFFYVIHILGKQRQMYIMPLFQNRRFAFSNVQPYDTYPVHVILSYVVREKRKVR